MVPNIDWRSHGKSTEKHGHSDGSAGYSAAMCATVPEQRPEGFPGQRLMIIPAAIAVQAARQPVTRDLCVTHIGTFSAASGHYVERPNGTPQHILIACLSGSGSCILAGQEHQVVAGDLLFLPPRKAHVYGATPRAPWTIFWIHFRGQRAGDYLSSLGVSSTQPLVTVDDPAVLVEAFEDTYRHTHHGFNEASMTGLATAFARLLGLARVHQRTGAAGSRRAENRILKVLALLRADLAHPWTLAELAHSAQLSIPHFTELCRRQSGMSPLALLIRLRLQRAVDLLQQGNHNVAEAAHAVGYDDPFYFSRLFRKHLGMPPSACRHGP